jgi:hypothetical protein
MEHGNVGIVLLKEAPILDHHVHFFFGRLHLAAGHASAA